MVNSSEGEISKWHVHQIKQEFNWMWRIDEDSD